MRGGRVPNIHVLSDPSHPNPVRQHTCVCSLGEDSFASLFNAVGEAALSSAFGEFYGLYLRFQPRATEKHILHVFRKHVPPELEAAFLDVYRRLHGGPLSPLRLRPSDTP